MQVQQEVLRELEERLRELEQQVASVRRDIEVLLGHTVRPSNPRGSLSPRARKFVKQRAAARARAAKPVGSGREAVGSPSTKRKLEREAKKYEDDDS